ncbi:MAG TPA: arginine--tRNA ligase, partial [Burkholderiales bacterium]|nr:arginine--tRNA ligase [Burkholderiales bacterium]
MATDPKAEIEKALRKALAQEAPQVADIAIVLERPKQAGHGDFSSNVALQLGKALKKNPRELANALATRISLDFLEKPEVAGPGFINFRLKAAAKHAAVRRALEEGTDFGRAKHAKGERVQVEFVSANPTGPLHVGHGRQAALGDAIAALLESQGHAVTREFYYNDAGAQIEKLALSVQARARGRKPGDPGWPEEAYNGEYIEDIARDFAATGKSLDGLDDIRRFAVDYLRREQDADLQAFGVKFDVYYLESSLYTEGKVEAVVRKWALNGKTYDAGGALWLRTTDYGDDKDRVVR